MLLVHVISQFLCMPRTVFWLRMMIGRPVPWCTCSTCSNGGSWRMNGESWTQYGYPKACTFVHTEPGIKAYTWL